MGLFSGIKKLFKGIGKVVKKVVSGVVKLGKKVVKGVGKVMGKLGPIGTIAIGILAPYALGAIAGANLGFLSTAASKALEFGSFIKSAVAAPFKALGQVAGKGISTLGQSVGGKFASITDKIATGLGYSGGSVSEGVKNIFGEVGTKWDVAVGKTATVENIASGAGALDTGVLSGGEVAKGSVWDISEGVEFRASFEPRQAGEGFFGSFDPFTEGAPMTSEEFMKATPISMPGDFVVDNQKFMRLSEAERLSFEQAFEQGPQSSLFDKLKEGLSGLVGLSGLGGTPTAGSISPVTPPSEGYDAITAASSDPGGGQGGLGRSFHAQNLTGFMETEEFARMMAQGLFGGRGVA